MGLIINLIFIFGLLLLGYICGSVSERRHYASIRLRESAWLSVPLLTNKTPLDSTAEMSSGDLAVGSVVVSVDYFKRFLSQIRMFFGGEMGAYASLVDRGKREALLRMRESQPDADAFLNVRIATSSLSRGQAKTIGSVEVVAYGTAVQYANGVRSEGA